MEASRRNRHASGRHRAVSAARRGRRGIPSASNLLGRFGLALGVGAVVVTVATHALGWSLLIVRSGSMEPAVPVGSLVIARPVSARDVRVGDPIAVQRSGPGGPITVLHRVVALTDRTGEPQARLRGDANPVPDPDLVPLSGAVLRPVLVLPRAGFAITWLRAGVLGPGPLLAAAGVLGLWLIWGSGGRGRRAGTGNDVARRSIVLIVRRNLLLRQPR